MMMREPVYGRSSNSDSADSSARPMSVSARPRPMLPAAIAAWIAASFCVNCSTGIGSVLNTSIAKRSSGRLAVNSASMRRAAAPLDSLRTAWPCLT